MANLYRMTAQGEQRFGVLRDNIGTLTRNQGLELETFNFLNQQGTATWTEMHRLNPTLSETVVKRMAQQGYLSDNASDVGQSYELEQDDFAAGYSDNDRFLDKDDELYEDEVDRRRY